MKTLMVVLAVLAGASLSVGCSKAQGLEAKPARPVKAQTVVPAPPHAGVRYSATIEPFDQVPLAFCSAAAATEGGVPYSLAIAWGEEPYSRVFMMRIIANG